MSNQPAPTLPVVSINYLGDAKTELHGYVNEMDPAYMRDAIIPLDKDRNVNISIECKDYNVDSLSYAILSLDTQRNISKNELEFNKKNREDFENLMQESSTNLDNYYDKKNPIVQVFLFVIGIFILIGIAYYVLLYLSNK